MAQGGDRNLQGEKGAGIMGESQRWKMTRKNLIVNNSLANAESQLYKLYYLYWREHRSLADLIEIMLLKIDDVRADLKAFQQSAWESCPPQFDDVGEMPALLEEARHDVAKGDRQCRGYLSDLEAGEHLSSRLLSKRDVESQKLWESSSPSPPASLFQKPLQTGDT